MKIFKFGGSSVKDATAIKRVSKIISEHPECRIVVVSATKNTTNELETIAESSALSEKNLTSILIQKLIDRHREIARELELDIELSIFELENELTFISDGINVDGEISGKRMDSLYSIGERLSSLIISRYLKNTLNRNVFYKDVREVLKTNNEWGHASPLVGETKKSISIWMNTQETDLLITQGFIGSTLNGETTTLGREGSDYSATILAEAIEADEVVIWTDVAGVATCDPRRVAAAKFINELSYKHAALLAQHGAKVLFERTLEPASRKKFSVIVKSTLSPEEVGSKIYALPLSPGPIGVAISDDILTIVGEKLLTTEFAPPFESLPKYEIYKQTSSFISLKFSNEDIESALVIVHQWVLKYLRS